MMKIGDSVEYFVGDKGTGVCGVITGFSEDRAFVLCPSGHEWLLRKSSLVRADSTRPVPTNPPEIEKRKTDGEET